MKFDRDKLSKISKIQAWRVVIQFVEKNII